MSDEPLVIHDPRDFVFDVWRSATPEQRRRAAGACYEYDPESRTFRAILPWEPPDEYACPWGAAEPLALGPAPSEGEICRLLSPRDPAVMFEAVGDFVTFWDSGLIPPAVLRLALRTIDEEAGA